MWNTSTEKLAVNAHMWVGLTFSSHPSLDPIGPVQWDIWATQQARPPKRSTPGTWCPDSLASAQVKWNQTYLEDSINTGVRASETLVSDLTEGEDRQRGLHPFGHLRIISDINHHLQVGQPVYHLQDEVFHPAAPEDDNKQCSCKTNVHICSILVVPCNQIWQRTSKGFTKLSHSKHPF